MKRENRRDDEQLGDDEKVPVAEEWSCEVLKIKDLILE